MARATAVWLVAGATTHTSPTADSASASWCSPGAATPSSLVTRIRTWAAYRRPSSSVPPVTAAVASPGTGFNRRDVVAFSAVSLAALVTLLLELTSVRAEVVFVVSGVAVAGLAYVLGEATDQAGEAAGPQVAALLNASFGNLPELIIVILTINQGLIDVAKASIIGSVLGNLLFILGWSILLGGWHNGPLRFDRRRAGVNASLVTIAVVALGVPTLFANLQQAGPHEVERLSYWVAGVMFVLYAAYLFHSFQRPSDSGLSAQEHDGPGGARWTARQAIAVLTLTAIATG